MDGLEREYILTVPASYDGGTATPLVFNFHGFTSEAIAQFVYSQLSQTAEAEGFILVTPQGTLNSVGARFWNAGPGLPDDVSFVDQLLTSLQSELCIDPARVFSTGISNGGFMSSRLACVLSGRIAAIAPVAGTTFPGSCDARPVPVIAFHGTNDLLVSLGPIENTAIPGWASHNACTGPTEQDPLAGTVGVRLVRYDGCDGGATVELYVVFDVDTVTAGDQGGGHTWPGSTLVLPPAFKDLLGQTTQEISANALMWDFFLAHPLPNAKPVGGISLDSGLRPLPLATANPGSPPWAVLVGIVGAACLLALGGGAWYARQRWLT
ncbi:MAG: polyhydroxybutyrate depolymerase [Planctomycetes bacterium]|nr:polyhydroxybutyrate depolymerase [Planctomycetota bacterium]